MPSPLLHISSISIDGDGWLIARKNDNSIREDDDVKGSIVIIPSCRRLLEETHLTLSCDFFGKSCVTENAGNDDGGKYFPLERLPHRPNLADCLLRVMADIKRMGAPGRRDRHRNEQHKGDSSFRRGRGNRRHNGRVAMMEEQRKLRQENEQQKLERSTQQGGVMPDDGDDRIIQIEDETEPAPVDELEVPVERRLAAVFNSVRVLIEITRPMLIHPQSQDFTLKMNPSIKKEGKGHRFYLISKHVYSCVSLGSWKEIKREFSKLLDELQDGSANKMLQINNDAKYELGGKDWFMTLFNHDLFMNEELLANKCMAVPNMNPEGALKLHAAIIDRFENDDGHSQQIMLNASIIRLKENITSAISRMFRGARLTVYGSCLSGLALEGSHDVDVSIYIPELDEAKKSFDAGRVPAEEYERRMRRIIFKVRDSLQYCRSGSFFDLFAVTRSRVPVIKGKMYARNPHIKDGSLAFDLCFLNDIAVVNSSLLREYSLFHKHVRILMLSVKSFAKFQNVSSASEGTLSSYSWLNLVVFYLQCIGMLPVLQCPMMMEEHGQQFDPSNPWHFIDGLETFFLTKDVVVSRNIWKRSSCANYDNLGVLLYGFFNFYCCIFPVETVAVSIRFGKIALQKTALHSTSKLWRLSIEDPFETCNSHCPHDLGRPINEEGQLRINKALLSAKCGFQELLGMPPEALLYVDLQSVSDGITSNFLSSLLRPSKSNNTKIEAPGLSPTNFSSLGRPENNNVDKGRLSKELHQNFRSRRRDKRDGEVHKSLATHHNATSTRPGINDDDTKIVNTRVDEISTNGHPRHSKRGENLHKNRGTTRNATSTRPGRNGSVTEKVDSNTNGITTSSNTQKSQENRAASSSKFMANQKDLLPTPSGKIYEREIIRDIPGIREFGAKSGAERAADTHTNRKISIVSSAISRGRLRGIQTVEIHRAIMENHDDLNALKALFSRKAH